LGVGPAPPLAQSVLIVDDEFLVAQGTQMQVEDMGVAVCATAGSADEALILATRHRPALVVMDLRLPGEGDGVDAAVAIHRNVGSKIIFITGSRDPESLERIARLHPAPVLFKPVAGSQLEQAVRSALGPAAALGEPLKGAAGV
jgi:DNA-binding NarL/FixJ family response regulator